MACRLTFAIKHWFERAPPVAASAAMPGMAFASGQAFVACNCSNPPKIILRMSKGISAGLTGRARVAELERVGRSTNTAIHGWQGR